MHREHHKVTWMHPRSRHWHLLDYVITRKEDQNDVKDTRVMRGADCETDHQMVRSRVAFSVWRAHVRNKVKAPNRLHTRKINDKQTKAQLEEEMIKALKESEVLEQNTVVELQWKALRMVVYNTAEKVCGKPKRKHKDWFDKTDTHLNNLLKQRNNAPNKHTFKQE